MIGKCPETDRILVAQLAGEAWHHATWRELGGDEETAAMAGLRALLGGRAGCLLAGVAGVLEEFPVGRPSDWTPRTFASNPSENEQI